MDNSIRLQTLILLKLKDCDLSKLSDQELFDKYEQTEIEFKKIQEEKVKTKSKDIYSF